MIEGCSLNRLPKLPKIPPNGPVGAGAEPLAEGCAWPPLLRDSHMKSTTPAAR